MLTLAAVSYATPVPYDYQEPEYQEPEVQDLEEYDGNDYNTRTRRSLNGCPYRVKIDIGDMVAVNEADCPNQTGFDWEYLAYMGWSYAGRGMTINEVSSISSKYG